MRHTDLLFHSILEHAYDFFKKKNKKISIKHRLEYICVLTLSLGDFGYAL